MKDFAFWRGALHNAKTALILKSVGEELGNFKNQSNLLGDEAKLTEAQLETLRLDYSLKMKKFEKERLDIRVPGKPKFKS